MSSNPNEFKKIFKLYESKEAELQKLTDQVTTVTFLAALAQAAIRFTHVSSHWQVALMWVGAIVIEGILLAKFLAKAHQSELGIRRYLKIEKTLLINEMPNIFQIISLLGFLNVLLKEEWVKIAVSILITFLLMVYLTSKRRDMVTSEPAIADKVSGDTTTWLSIFLGSIVGLAVYGLASLISVQISY